MSCRTFARPAPLLLKNAEIPDDMVHPVPGTVLKIPGTPDQAIVIADNQAKMRSLIILDKDIPVLCGNGFRLFAGKGAVRQDISNYKGMIMPVTKCEPETTRKASRKSVKTQETVLSALLAQTEEVSVPLASLIKSPLNVRGTSLT
ncbi:Uncharacterised protein [Shigella sonnei]|nr:Uncharacterised protein [Shigella sonnei]